MTPLFGPDPMVWWITVIVFVIGVWLLLRRRR